MATYGEAQSSAGIPVEIPVEYPDDRNGLIMGIIFWGDVAGEFMVYKNGQPVVGGRTSPQNRTLQLDLSVAPIGVQIGDEVQFIATHYDLGLRTLKAVYLTKGT